MFKVECSVPKCEEFEWFINTGDVNFKRQMITRAGWRPCSIDIATAKISYMCQRCATRINKQYFGSETPVKANNKQTQKIPIPPTIPAYQGQSPARNTINDKFFSFEFQPLMQWTEEDGDYMHSYGWGGYAG